MKPRTSATVVPEATSGWTRAVVWASAAVILIFGLFPDAIVSFTQRSAPSVSTPTTAPAASRGVALESR
jgi:hypothetical protein